MALPEPGVFSSRVPTSRTVVCMHCPTRVGARLAMEAGVAPLACAAAATATSATVIDRSLMSPPLALDPKLRGDRLTTALDDHAPDAARIGGEQRLQLADGGGRAAVDLANEVAGLKADVGGEPAGDPGHHHPVRAGERIEAQLVGHGGREVGDGRAVEGIAAGDRLFVLGRL